MYIASLDCSRFRNLETAHIEFSKGFNVFYGDNAQGKSNLLEAVYALAFLKGFRAEKLSEMIAFGAEGAQLGAEVFEGGHRTRLGVEIHAHTRHAYVDGVNCTRARDYLGILRAVLFVPMDVGFLQTSPAERRSALDRMVFNLRPAYLVDLDQYQKVCKQKSAVLRQEEPDEKLLDTYDEQLAGLGERILRSRYAYFEKISRHLSEAFGAIFDESFACNPVYKCSTMRNEVRFGGEASIKVEDLVESWHSHLKNARSREIARQQITGGPHRDDWTLDLNGIQARYFASQGQQRSMSLAMKLAEITCLKKEIGVEPVFLLDDVSSELDPVRHRKLFDCLNGLSTQVFLTTTSKTHVHVESVGRMFRVVSGSVTDETGS